MSKPRLKCLTFDVTGTLIKYKLHIGEIYCLSAKKAGQECPNYDKMLNGFHNAYKTTGNDYPCFGVYNDMSTREWWNECVKRSFKEAGYSYDDHVYTKIFNRIYALFGSREPYSVFDDVLPFLDWIKECKDIKVGIITNACERYRDTIVPIMDLDPYFDFIVTASDSKYKKPARGILYFIYKI